MQIFWGGLFSIIPCIMFQFQRIKKIGKYLDLEGLIIKVVIHINLQNREKSKIRTVHQCSKVQKLPQHKGRKGDQGEDELGIFLFLHVSKLFLKYLTFNYFPRILKLLLCYINQYRYYLIFIMQHALGISQRIASNYY